MKTVKQDESISRSRFVDCPVCKNHTLKLKRTVQIGRCKSCNETYKIVIVYVKSGRKTKPTTPIPDTRTGKQTETSAETSPSSLESAPDTSSLGASSLDYSGLSNAIFGENHSNKSGDTGSAASQ